jgi:hypothetical protein
VQFYIQQRRAFGPHGQCEGAPLVVFQTIDGSPSWPSRPDTQLTATAQPQSRCWSVPIYSVHFVSMCVCDVCMLWSDGGGNLGKPASDVAWVVLVTAASAGREEIGRRSTLVSVDVQ